MTIRPIHAGDKAFFYRSVGELYASPAICHTIPAVHIRNTLDALLKGNPYLECFICEDGTNTPCGYILLSITWSNEAGGKCVLLEEIWVAEELRGRGIGHQMIEEVCRRHLDAVRFRLEVTATNTRAQALYRELGFEILDYLQMVRDCS